MKRLNQIVARQIYSETVSGPLRAAERLALQKLFDKPDTSVPEMDGCATLALLGLANVNLHDRICSLNSIGNTMAPVDAGAYFRRYPCVSQRAGDTGFNRKFFTDTMLNIYSLFSSSELLFLQDLDKDFQYFKRKIGSYKTDEQSRHSTYQYIWGSCELEGCTVDMRNTIEQGKDGIRSKILLLQDELFDHNFPKTQQDAISRQLTDLVMASNHLDALNFVSSVTNPRLLLCKDTVIRVHSLLTSDLDQYPCNYTNSAAIPSGIRDGLPVHVGCTYEPLIAKSDLLHGLDLALNAIHKQTDDFSQSVLTTVLLSYLQLFADGNKRTARLLGHAVLANSNRFPVVYSAVDAEEYVNALVLFYERTNLGAFKALFMKTAQRSVADFCNA